MFASYGLINVLHNINIDIYKGEIVTIIGSNGAGKSTLLMSVFGHPRIQVGQIIFNNHELSTLPTHKITKLGISIAPERRRLFDKMTTEENLLMGAISLNKIQTASNLQKIYSYFPILRDRANQRAGTLSGGEQQMLSIGRALMSAPSLLLLDEPSLGLAPQIIKKIFLVLKDIARSGTTIVLVEQNIALALEISERAYLLVNGEIKLSGNSNDLLKNPHIQSAYLGGSHR